MYSPSLLLSILAIKIAIKPVLAIHRTLSYLPNKCSTGSATICPQDCVKAITEMCSHFPIKAPPLPASHAAISLDQSLTSINVTSGTCTAQWDVTSKDDIDKGDPTYLQTLRDECVNMFNGALKATPNPSSDCATQAILGGVSGYNDDFTRNSDPIVAIYPIGTPGQCFATPHPDRPNSLFGYDADCQSNTSAVAKRDLAITRSLEPRNLMARCMAMAVSFSAWVLICVIAVLATAIDGGTTAGVIPMVCIGLFAGTVKQGVHCFKEAYAEERKRLAEARAAVADARAAAASRAAAGRVAGNGRLGKRSVPSIVGVPQPPGFDPCSSDFVFGQLSTCLQRPIQKACAAS